MIALLTRSRGAAAHSMMCRVETGGDAERAGGQPAEEVRIAEMRVHQIG